MSAAQLPPEPPRLPDTPTLRRFFDEGGHVFEGRGRWVFDLDGHLGLTGQGLSPEALDATVVKVEALAAAAAAAAPGVGTAPVT